MLNWAQPFNIFCFLDNREYHFEEPAFECLLAIAGPHVFEGNAGQVFQQLNSFAQVHPGWLFGHFGYDLKNETEQLTSTNPDGINFPDCSFFVPETVIQLTGTKVTISTLYNADDICQNINTTSPEHDDASYPSPDIRQRFSRQAYIDTVRQLQAHILRGDCYEVNFCQEFYAHARMQPLRVYENLVQRSPNPFSALYRLRDRYCLCASPERYLRRRGTQLLSQPIKGTARRNLHDLQADAQLREELRNSGKDRSENVMVVDLVRNDLSKICLKGTVKVDELYGIYSFPQVHQMISTISGQVAEGASWVQLIEATFPMGSMTGAPKKRVMELIEQYEATRRGLFSGAIGYVTPQGDFDFNVVIRSLLYNAAESYLSFQAGSAITFQSDPEKEWEECLLKAQAIRAVLS